MIVKIYKKICWWIRHIRGRDVKTSVCNGNWSDDAVWDFGVPKDGDVVVVSQGHIITFDVDQSRFRLGTFLKNMGTFIVNRNPGKYCIKVPKGIDSYGRIECMLPNKEASMLFDFSGSEKGCFRFYSNPDFVFKCSSSFAEAKQCKN